MSNPNFKLVIRKFHEKDFTAIEKFDEDFKLVLEECKNFGWIYVAVVHEIVGYIAIIKGRESAYFDDDTMNWAEIRELHVKPQFQNQGVGTLLKNLLLKMFLINVFHAFMLALTISINQQDRYIKSVDSKSLIG